MNFIHHSIKNSLLPHLTLSERVKGANVVDGMKNVVYVIAVTAADSNGAAQYT